jgi:transcriptional regulator with PAS, ATPase and Fis domain
MLRVCEQIINYARFNLAVLVTGPTGSGKNVVAQALHACGPRAHQSWVAINCAAISPTLFEAELFGHTRGAFTGAIGGRQGFVARAHEGTLFVEEIGELPLEMQPKLLRFLDHGEYYRVGDPQPRTADIRLIAATNRD